MDHKLGTFTLTSLNYRCSELAVPTTCCSAIKLQSCELKLPTFFFATSVRNTTPAATCISHQNSLSIFPNISINRTCLKSSSVHRTTKVYHDFYAGALLEHGGPLQHRASLMKRLSEFVRENPGGVGVRWQLVRTSFCQYLSFTVFGVEVSPVVVFFFESCFTLFMIYAARSLTVRPLKSYRNRIGQDRLPTIIFSGAFPMKLWGVWYVSLPMLGQKEWCFPPENRGHWGRGWCWGRRPEEDMVLVLLMEGIRWEHHLGWIKPFKWRFIIGIPSLLKM